MSDRRDLFPGSSVSSTSPNPTDGGEISLRDEMSSILRGTGGDVPKGQKFILRRMRTDDDGNFYTCTCVDETTLESDLDYPCPFCLGTGLLWDEELVTGYKVSLSAAAASKATDLIKAQYGVMELPAKVFYFEYDVNPHIKDVIVELQLDLEGDLTIPYIREAEYETNLLRPLRGDRGRVEYWACYCSSKNIATQASS